MHIYFRNFQTFWLGTRFFMVTAQNLSLDSNSPKFVPSSIRGYPWHKNEINKIRRGHYGSNDFQDSTKTKITENKHWVIFQEVLFFNAFQLGAENKIQIKYVQVEKYQKSYVYL